MMSKESGNTGSQAGVPIPLGRYLGVAGGVLLAGSTLLPIVAARPGYEPMDWFRYQDGQWGIVLMIAALAGSLLSFTRWRLALLLPFLLAAFALIQPAAGVNAENELFNSGIRLGGGFFFAAAAALLLAISAFVPRARPA